MIKKKNLWRLMPIMMAAIAIIGLSSCEKLSEGGQGSLTGWYTDLSQVAKQSDFNAINEAIDNEEVLSSYRTGKYIASYDLFIGSDGQYNDSAASFGRLRFTIPTVINTIRIVDSNTLIFYVGYLYVDGRGYGDAVYKLYAGRIFGNMAYYGSPTYYTYAKADNKILVSNGDIYTIVDGGLIKDGGSSRLSKYDPTQRH